VNIFEKLRLGCGGVSDDAHVEISSVTEQSQERQGTDENEERGEERRPERDPLRCGLVNSSEEHE
jgi:hypothetical protein